MSLDLTAGEPPAPSTTAPEPASSATPHLEARNVRWYIASFALIGAAGSASMTLAPIIAVVTLHATSTQVGLISLINLAVALALQIPFAAWADRRPFQLRVMRLSCLVSAAIAAAIPVLYSLGGLSLAALLGTSALLTVASTFRGALGHSVVNSLVGETRRMTVIGRLNGITSAADTSAQAGSAGLISLVPAPVAMLASTVASFLAPLFLGRIDSHAVKPVAADSAPTVTYDLRSVLRLVVRRPGVWMVTAFALSNAFVEPVFVPFIIRGLKISPSLVGLLLAVGALGGVAAGYLTGPIFARYGDGVGLVAAAVVCCLGIAPMIVAPAGAIGFVCVVGYELATAFGGTLLVASTFGRLQQESTPSNVARTMSTVQVLLQLSGLLGLLLGVLLTLQFSARLNFTCYLVGAILVALVGLGVARSPKADLPADPSTT
jgi:hypothetical protein